MNFCYLGSGSKGNALAVWSGEFGLLLDCGLSAAQIIKRMRLRGIEPAWFKAVFLGQAHGDHTTGLDSWQKRHRTKVYATPQTCERARYEMSYCPIALRETRTVGPFTVTTVPVWHDNISGAAVNDETGAVTFIVECAGKKLALLYESGRVTFEMCAAAQGADALLIEANYDANMLRGGPIERIVATHLSNQQAAEYLCNLDAQTKIVLAIHRSLNNNDPSLVETTLQEALEEAGSTARLVLAEQDRPTEIYEIVEAQARGTKGEANG